MLDDFLHAANHFEVEGFFHTSSRKRYLIRILEAAAITWAGEIIINLAFHNVDPVTHKILKPDDWEEKYAPEPAIKKELQRQLKAYERHKERNKQ